MTVTLEDTKKVARLARLKFSEAELEFQRSQLEKILDWVQQLDKVNVNDVEPMITPVPMKMHLREDKTNDGNIQQEVLANAPNNNYGYFSVPKVVE